MNPVPKRLLLSLCLFASSSFAQLGPGGATASFKGSLPPKPVADLNADQQAAVTAKLATVTAAFQAVKKHPRAADADIFIKAVRYALDFHEWYDKKAEDGVKKAQALLDEAARRIDSLKLNQTPWMEGSGQKVLGFYSAIDNSAQPYGVEVPEGLEFGAGKKPVPMWIWLHGRGDTATDLSFVYSRLMAKKPGQFQPKGTIVIHPFGRYCNGWKSAGETDVFEARDDALARFNVDENRIALAGFSMGGAGAWHLGAHFADQWACVHTGAGFADVKRYTKLTPDKYPAWYEQTLWGVYDVPDYARNFHNVPLVSYSGEVDAQRDSAEYMMEVLGKEGLHPPHLIGPGMPHKYHPETIKEVQKLIEEHVARGRNPWPDKVSLQTKTMAYSRQFWVSVMGMEKSWAEARVEAAYDPKTMVVTVTTRNVSSLGLWHRPGKDRMEPMPYARIDIDGQKGVKADQLWGLTGEFDFVSVAVKADGKWVSTLKKPDAPRAGKSQTMAGPMDDVFKHRFVVVLPDGKSSHKAVDAWVQAESAHFLSRWRSLMRGDVQVKKASEITGQDMQLSNLVIWGDPESSYLLRKALAAGGDNKLAVTWNKDSVGFGGQTFPAAGHVPVFCAPSPFAVGRMIVINSGLTFREAHDKTNSLQNPKLPDWAILDITQPPNAESAGKVVAADFFDENWQVIPRVKDPAAKE